MNNLLIFTVGLTGTILGKIVLEERKRKRIIKGEK